MTTTTITLTSKNQVTLPAAYVRKLKLGKHRKLNVTFKGDALVIAPQPTLADRLQPLWAELKASKGAIASRSDEQLKQAARDIIANKAV